MPVKLSGRRVRIGPSRQAACATENLIRNAQWTVLTLLSDLRNNSRSMLQAVMATCWWATCWFSIGPAAWMVARNVDMLGEGQMSAGTRVNSKGSWAYRSMIF